MAPKQSLLRLLLAASAATAQVTTSFWMPPGIKLVLGTDRIRWVASVIGAEGDRVTMAVSPDNDPDYEALAIDTAHSVTYTFASTLVEWTVSDVLGDSSTSTTGVTRISAMADHLKCEMQTSAASGTCTYSMNPYLAGIVRCATGTRAPEVHTRLWTFTDPDTTGVETIVRSFPGRESSAVPEWCSGGEGASVPSNELVSTESVPSEDFVTYQFVITAGEEKLPSATTGAGPSTGNVEPTGTPTAPGGADQTTGTGNGAGAPMKTMAPMIAGLGAAVAVFL